MRKEDKGIIIEQLASAIKEYEHLYLVDTATLDAAATSDLRRACFKENIKLIVAKNTLLTKAFESITEVDYSPMFEVLKGSTTLMLSNVASDPAKLIKEKGKKKGIPALKAAFAEESFYIGAEHL